MSMGKDPIAILGHEHKIIQKVVHALTQIASTPELAEKSNPDTLRKVVHFMREFADQCHHAKEEDLLFPAMEKKGVPESGCPLGALRREHEQGRALVKSLEEATDALATKSPGAANGVARVVCEIRDLYGNHIWKEDEMVFPMVDRLFSQEERQSLFEQFEQAEKDIGSDHEALESFANSLSAR